MSYWQRIKNILIGIAFLIFSLDLFFFPREEFQYVALILCILLFVRGIRQLIFYFSMARHMVGGKTVLYRAVIVLDLAMFCIGLVSVSSFVIMIYLLIFYGYSGAVDILRANEARHFGTKVWKTKMVNGIIRLVFAILLFVLGLIFYSTDLLIYGFCVSLVYSGIMRIITSFRKTAIVYIQ